MPHMDLTGQGASQLGALCLAFILSALVGLEREFRQKSAGLRTYALVGVASALFMLISKYGYMDVLVSGRVVLDPSRVAAQIVSGIGFIGGGVIFLRQDVVRGLTTAASVWLTAALGMACGAGLPILAIATTAGHIGIMFLLPKLAERLPRIGHDTVRLQIAYDEERGLLRNILATCGQLHYSVEAVTIDKDAAAFDGTMPAIATNPLSVRLTLKGQHPVTDLIAAISEVTGVRRVDIREDADGPP